MALSSLLLINNINILGLNINIRLSWKPHITSIAKAVSISVSWEFCSGCVNFSLHLNYFSSIGVWSALLWSIALIFGVGPAPLIFLIELSPMQGDSLTLPYSLRILILYLFVGMLVLFLFSIGTTLAVARGNWRPAFHHLCVALVAQDSLPPLTTCALS